MPAPPAIDGPAYLRLVGLGALVGIPAALLAVGFIALVHQLEHLLWTELPDALGASSPPWYLVIGLPVVGAAIVVFARTLLPGDGGHAPLGGINATPTPVRYAPGVALAALGALPFGAVLGPEAPLIALGSVVGIGLTSWVRLGDEERAVVATAGSFAAIAALFGGPLVAGLLLVEAGISRGAALIAGLLPGLVAAAIGYSIFIGFGDWGGLREATLTVPDLPGYTTLRVVDLLLAIVIGIVAALLMSLVHGTGRAIERRGPGKLGMAGLLIAGGLVVGLIAQLADVLGANSQDVLFSGQTSIPAVVAEGSFGIVLLLVVAKSLGYMICLACGFRGGPVFPAIFIGIALAMLAVVAFDVSPTLAVSVGTAAGLASATRLLFAALLFATLIAGSAGFDTVPAVVLAASAAWIVATTLERRLEKIEAEAGAAQARGSGPSVASSS
ncbi:chloride channel protein [Conexibacter sp. CPCC 206217]|uniref:chloride channel protein n=1 Tax=Conexibacter sp. CPCC 206217 TaxID=3064574 RepID=UPI0027238F89|nr:chloride channel protein [Conexibacter sp. CPCC 206217]MDO8211750.1 chloride channel protein [Conexibacter sp. CPCC 206217]